MILLTSILRSIATRRRQSFLLVEKVVHRIWLEKQGWAGASLLVTPGEKRNKFNVCSIKHSCFLDYAWYVYTYRVKLAVDNETTRDFITKQQWMLLWTISALWKLTFGIQATLRLLKVLSFTSFLTKMLSPLTIGKLY